MLCTRRNLLGLLIVSVILPGCGGGNVPAPTAYKKYDHKDSEWTCEYPADWDVKGGGKKNHYGSFTKGGAAIKVSTDLSGSLMGDLAGAARAGQTPTVENAPVQKVHTSPQSTEEMKEMFNDYKEVGKPEVLQTQLGDARRSEFTAAGGLGGAVHGYRVTILGRDKRFRVVCSCSESNWATLKPAFEKVLESFGHGPG